MKLIPSQNYTLNYLKHPEKITLLSIIKGTPVTYRWKQEDGEIFINRQQDVDKWFKFNQIEICQ